MSIWQRTKSTSGRQKTLPELTAAATLTIPDTSNVFTVTGTTGITGMHSASIWPGRQITLLGTHATGPAFTDTAIASTAVDKIHLSAALTLILGASVTFTQGINGSWWESARAING